MGCFPRDTSWGVIMYDRNYSPQKRGYQEHEVTKATALGYDPEIDNAPRVIASGKGILAEKIIKLAKENGIPIREDPLLAEALARVDIGQAIPPELYKLVAEILAFIYRVEKRLE